MKSSESEPSLVAVPSYFRLNSYYSTFLARLQVEIRAVGAELRDVRAARVHQRRIRADILGGRVSAMLDRDAKTATR